MNDDLDARARVVRTVDDERKARFSAIASITAIVLLIVANITPAAIDRWRAIFAAPPAVPSYSSPVTQPAVAASYVPCRKFNAVGASLRWEIAQWRGDGYVITCSYWGRELMTRDEVSL